VSHVYSIAYPAAVNPSLRKEPGAMPPDSLCFSLWYLKSLCTTLL
jgi:hypothetical protein